MGNELSSLPDERDIFSGNKKIVSPESCRRCSVTASAWAMYELHAKQKIEAGLAAVAQGKTVTHEEAKRRLLDRAL